jgi:multiple sugar transport system substrate-binding protein
MKRTMRLLAVVLVIAMLAALSLAGCAGQSTTKAGGTTAAGQKTTIRFTSWQNVYAQQDEAAAAEYVKTHPNVEIKFEYYGAMNSQEYLKKIDMMVMGNEAIDVIMAPAPSDYSIRANSGTFMALDDMLKAEGVVEKTAYTIDTSVNGKVYSLPSDLKSFFVMINGDYLKEAGLAVPSLDWTWQDYRDYAKKMTKGEGATKRYGSYFHTWNSMSLLGMYSYKQDSAMFKSATETTFADPMVKQFLQFRYDLEQVDKSSVPLADAKSLSMTYRDKFFKGEAAMIPIGSWMIPEIKDVSKYPHTFKTVFAALPVWDKTTGTPGMTNTANHYYGIAKSSKNPQAAYDFLRFYTTKGVAIRGVSMTGEAGVDKLLYVDKMVGADKSLYDYDSLKAVMTNPKWKDNVESIVPKFAAAMDTMVGEETSNFLMGQEKNIDNTIAAMVKRGNEIIAANK